ncbi:MAG: glucuronyl hydrolase [Bacteroides sp. SM1_62]|nr:MAG: glucuronyl hydrolase [Bacteroides sp. SM23_62]KPL23415.1 MAG: glucuronyl hydrolase [Bacteroides sp. SM1_62]
MNTPVKLAAGFIILLLIGCHQTSKDPSRMARESLGVASQQLSLSIENLGDTDLNPRTAENGVLRQVRSGDWTSGFYPGCLWYLYEYTGDEKFLEAARKFTMNLQSEQFNGGTHDLGFMMYCSFGNGYRLTQEEGYRDVIIQSAKTLCTRFNPNVGCIKSWDHNEDKWQYPVIIDNMMNLELLFWVAKETNDSGMYNIALSHTETTMKNHFREDHSSWHVLDYDTISGEVLHRQTHQGYSDESAWARGQSWGFYGYTMVYRETGEQKFLDQARGIADFILNHENLPGDMVPYWDFNAPNIPDEPRDASAAAILCSGLYELSSHLGEEGETYKQAADKILISLSSDKYQAGVGENNNFILKHSVGSRPADSEVDVPLIYADYYFIEACMRKLELESNK